MTSGMTSSRANNWASIRRRRRKDGGLSYVVLYWLDGKQRPLTFRDEVQAEAFRSAIKAHGVERALAMNGYEVRPTSTQAPVLTVAGWVRRYIDNLTGVEQYTIDCYERYLRLDIAPTLGRFH